MNEQLASILTEVGDLLYFFKPFIPLIIYKVEMTYKLNKAAHPKDVSKVCLPPELKQKYTSVEINQLMSETVKNALLEFSEVMINEFPPDILTNFYNNINELKVSQNPGIMLIGSEGRYSTKYNKIKIATVKAIFHELFHMATTRYKKGVSFSGFHQCYYNPKLFDIGRGINEGYTEIMTQRYFGKKHKLTKAYLDEVAIVEKLEQIVGQEKMESLYFKSDLPGLIKNLMQYTTKSEVENFISGVDLICGYARDLYLFKNPKVENAFRIVYGFLLKVNLIKLRQQYENGLISANELFEQSTKYVESLGTKIKISNHTYHYLTSENTDEIFKSVYGDFGSNSVQDVDTTIKK